MRQTIPKRSGGEAVASAVAAFMPSSLETIDTSPPLTDIDCPSRPSTLDFTSTVPPDTDRPYSACTPSSPASMPTDPPVTSRSRSLCSASSPDFTFSEPSATRM